MALRNDQKLLLGAGALTAVLWVIPELRPFVLPLVYYNTHIHELGHALTAILTGGSAQHILVFANGSGVTPISGGFMPVVAAAGYVGSSVVGGLMILLSKEPKSARSSLWLAMAFMAFSMVFFVRGDLVGLISGLGWTAALALLAAKLKPDHARFASAFLGFQLCATSVLSFLALVQISAVTEQHNDAKIMEEVTRVPAIVWSVGWMVLGLGLMVLCLKAAWSGSRIPRA